MKYMMMNRKDEKIMNTLVDIITEIFAMFRLLDMDARSLKTGYGYSALHTAVISRDIKAVQVLTSTDHKVCDLESRDSMGFTALHLATLQGGEELVQLLVQAGSDVNSRTKVSIPEKSPTISEHFKQKKCVSALRRLRR